MGGGGRLRGGEEGATAGETTWRRGRDAGGCGAGCVGCELVLMAETRELARSYWETLLCKV